MTALDVITRGVDSSGRVVRGTRQNFQFYDRLNQGSAQGLLVIIQGSWSFADASGNTHARAMCMDYRTWNLTAAVREATIRRGRALMGTMWYRTEADGFAPHIHNNLIGDRPAALAAQLQVAQYKQGLNGLANRHRDRNPFRPKTIRDYKYIEDDMFTSDDRKLLQEIRAEQTKEAKRDEREGARDRRRFEKLVTLLGNQADQLGVIIGHTADESTRTELRSLRENLLLTLKNDPDVKEKDNPSDDALGEMNMG